MSHKIICFFLCLSCWLGASAQSHSKEIGAETDDDSYLAQGSDRYYTAGTFVYYRQALKVNSTTHLQNKVLGFELGQKLYTPQSGSISFYGNPDDPRYIDRPFAAYLYVGANLNYLYKDESNLKLSAQVGVVGPAALGKETQQTIHNLFGLYHPSGWQYQIDNDFEINLSAQYNRLLARSAWADVSLTSYANLGNGFTGAGIGPMLRLGDFNQLFNSESTQSTAIKSANFKPLHDHELFFYYQPQFNVVVYDATVQGSLFNKRSATSMEVTGNPERIVFSNQLGLGYSGKRFVLDVAAIFHTKDTKEMIQSHQWADVTLLYRFD
ncbi:MAG TPA: lipid A deacylase LpxR family protein [Mucilaginibacter sp.]|nr:lipid A deacylase LpxR family protein [Mucilaginibacter sp.]